jgi:hypothetical protein
MVRVLTGLQSRTPLPHSTPIRYKYRSTLRSADLCIALLLCSEICVKVHLYLSAICIAVRSVSLYTLYFRTLRIVSRSVLLYALVCLSVRSLILKLFNSVRSLSLYDLYCCTLCFLYALYFVRSVLLYAQFLVRSVLLYALFLVRSILMYAPCCCALAVNSIVKQ